MFTHVVDEAINRVEFEGGEVAAVYDDCATNPLEDFGIKGFAIARNERGYIPFDPEELFDIYDGALDDKGMALDDIEFYTNELRKNFGPQWWEEMTDAEDEIHWILEAFDAVDEANDTLKGMVSYTFKADDYYGWPEFRVVIDTDEFKKSWGPTHVEWQDVYQCVADDYARWAEGEVYVIGFTNEDGVTEYLSNVICIDPYDDKELIEFAKDNF